ncbi:hypothetical protein GEV43_17285 [Actinomadura sp. J1-007]|nr:hypothetical protein [Actinomadura sp. J1-007]
MWPGRWLVTPVAPVIWRPSGGPTASRRAADQAVQAQVTTGRACGRFCELELPRRTVLTEETGIERLLDIGTGLPTVGNVREIARRGVPDETRGGRTREANESGPLQPVQLGCAHRHLRHPWHRVDGGLDEAEIVKALVAEVERLGQFRGRGGVRNVEPGMAVPKTGQCLLVLAVRLLVRHEADLGGISQLAEPDEDLTALFLRGLPAVAARFRGDAQPHGDFDVLGQSRFS